MRDPAASIRAALLLFALVVLLLVLLGAGLSLGLGEFELDAVFGGSE